MPSDRLPYGRQSIDESDIAAVSEALRDEFLTTGPRVGAFEAALCEATGAAHAAALNSGTSALHAIYAGLGIGPGDEIVTSPLTFAATANAALYVGARPVFADVDPATGLLDPRAAEAAITSRTRAIVAVDYAGQPADYDALRDICRRHRLALVADAAHSLGATERGRAVGTLADATMLSFHPVKHITTMEGGAVLTGDAALQRRVTEFRSHGMVRDATRLRRHDGPWYHEMQALGYNYRITDVACALGLSQLRRLPAFLARRREIAARYDDAFGADERLMTPAVRPGTVPAWHLYVLRVSGPDPARRRRALFEALQARGIGCQVHYLPVYRHPYYEDLGYPAGLCPAAEDLYARILAIPLYPAMSDEDVERVVAAVRSSVEATLGTVRSKSHQVTSSKPSSRERKPVSSSASSGKRSANSRP